MKKHFTKFLCLFMFLLLFTSKNEIISAESIESDNSEVINCMFNKSKPNLFAVNTKDENNSTDNTLVTISGKAQLPKGEVAPEGGIIVKISSLAEENNYYEDPSYSTTVTIEEGATEANYELKSPDDRIKLKYELMIKKSVKTIIPYERILYTDGHGKVSKTKRKINSEYSVYLTPYYCWSLDLVLQRLENPADYYNFPTINGTIKLPKGEVAPKDGLEIKICSYPSDKSNTVYEDFYDTVFSLKVKIPKGKNEIKYTLPSAKGPRTLAFILQGPTAQNYLSVFYYSKNGLVPDLTSASTLKVNNDLHGLNVRIKKMKSINGTIKIPENVPTSDDDIKISLSLYNIPSNLESLSTESRFVIPKGKREIAYSLNAKPGKYIIKYKIENPKSSLPVNFVEGYIGKNDTVEKKEDAAIVILKDKDINIGNLILKQAPCLKGVIELPDKNRVTYDNLSIYIIAKSKTDSSKFFYTYVTIPGNRNRTSFSIPVKSDTYTLQYVINPLINKTMNYKDLYDYSVGKYKTPSFKCDYIKKAYYTEDGFIKHFKITTDSVSNIEFKLANKKYIEGELIVPEDSAAFYQVDLIPILLEENEVPSSAVEKLDNCNLKNPLTILGASKKTKFSFPQQEGNYVLVCICSNNNNNNENNAFLSTFYAVGEATLDASKCKVVSSTDKGVQSITMRLPKAKHIQGTFSIPKNEIDFKYDTKISIELIKLTDGNEMTLHDIKEVTLKKYYSEVNYDFKVNSGKYILSYIIKNNTKYSSYSTERYYYKENGRTENLKEAFVLDVKDDDIKNINMTLVKK